MSENLAQTNHYPVLSFLIERSSSMQQWQPWIKIDDPHFCQVSHTADGFTIFDRSNGNSHLVETAKITSIERQSAVEFRGVNRSEGVLCTVNREQGGIRFAEILDVNYKEFFEDHLKTRPEWWIERCLAFGLWFLCSIAIWNMVPAIATYFAPLFLETHESPIFYIDRSTDYWWTQSTDISVYGLKGLKFFFGCVSLMLSAILLLVIYKVRKKRRPEKDASFYYYPSHDQLLVYYFNDGTRQIAATFFQQHSGALAGHADHLNAWQRARADQAVGVSVEVFAGRFL